MMKIIFTLVLEDKFSIPDLKCHQKILNVLGMNSIGIAMNATDISIPENIKQKFAVGHMSGNESKLMFLPEAVRGAGAIYSTVNDLLKSVSANLGLIVTKVNPAMEETHSIRYPFYELQVPFKDPSGNESTPYAYEGLSWFSTTNLGPQVVWHNGGINRYSSFVGFNPDKHIEKALENIRTTVDLDKDFFRNRVIDGGCTMSFDNYC